MAGGARCFVDLLSWDLGSSMLFSVVLRHRQRYLNKSTILGLKCKDLGMKTPDSIRTIHFILSQKYLSVSKSTLGNPVKLQSIVGFLEMSLPHKKFRAIFF